MKYKKRLKRRCSISVPGSDYRKIQKAAGSGIDHVFIDLEDSVSPKVKPEARKNVIKGLNELDWGTTLKCFRINGLDTGWCYQDIIEVVGQAGNNLDALMIPKVKYERDVHFVETLLEQVEKEHNIISPVALEILVEEVEAIENIKEIAAASDRIIALHFGVGDYMRSSGTDGQDGLGEPRFIQGDIWHYERKRLVIAARMNGLYAIDGPYPYIKNEAGYKKVAREALTLGMDGKWAIHPIQIAFANDVFTPHPKEVAQYRRWLAAFEEASAAGKGAIQMDGVMLDEAIVPMLESVIEQSEFLNS